MSQVNPCVTWQPPDKGKRKDPRFSPSATATALPPTRLAYDGKGNHVVKTAADLDAAAAALGGYAHGLYAEKWAPFIKELAVMVVR